MRQRLQRQVERVTMRQRYIVYLAFSLAIGSLFPACEPGLGGKVVLDVAVVEGQPVTWKPVLKGLKTARIAGQKVRFLPYSIKVDPSLSFARRLFGAANDREKGLAAIDSQAAPFMVDPHNAAFSPYAWGEQVFKMCLFAEKFQSIEEFRPRIEEMVSWIEKTFREQDKALYVEIPFAYNVYDKKFTPPWYSAFANGVVTTGLLKAYHTTGNKRYEDLASGLVRGLLSLRNRSDQNHPWVSMVDKNGFLWFEEYPCSEEPMIHVLNGHIFAIQGLYDYYLSDPRPEVLLCIRAGITTDHKYLDEYRVPGDIHRYSLYPKAGPDYGQLRNLSQLQWLYDITGEPYFMFMRSIFEMDYKLSGKKIR
jgi:hypothetical protein